MKATRIIALLYVSAWLVATAAAIIFQLRFELLTVFVLLGFFPAAIIGPCLID